MKIKTILTGILAIGGLVMASSASAAPFDATTKVCPTTSEFISVNQVTANGGATGCYGVFEGNDPGPSGDGISIGGGTVLDFLSKYGDHGPGENPLNLSGGSGTWSFASPVTFDGTWMFVIKQGNCWAGWTFGGGTYTGGTYEVTFGTRMGNCVGLDPHEDFSHFSIYGMLGDREVPEPATLGLLGLGLLGIGLARRRWGARS